MTQSGGRGAIPQQRSVRDHAVRASIGGTRGDDNHLFLGLAVQEICADDSDRGAYESLEIGND